jgi:hypothetical protein
MLLQIAMDVKGENSGEEWWTVTHLAKRDGGN